MESDRQKWNQKYIAGDHCVTEEPVPILQSIMPSLPHGKALDIATGTGRNAIYLAQHGYEVTGVDISEEGLMIAEKRALSLGFNIPWVRADIDYFRFPRHFSEGYFNVIVCTNFLDRNIFKEIPIILQKNGVVIYQTLLENDVGRSSTNSHKLFPNELLNAFNTPQFRIVQYFEDIHNVKPFSSIVAIRK